MDRFLQPGICLPAFYIMNFIQKHCILDAEITVAQNAEIVALTDAAYIWN